MLLFGREHFLRHDVVFGIVIIYITDTHARDCLQLHVTHFIQQPELLWLGMPEGRVDGPLTPRDIYCLIDM